MTGLNRLQRGGPVPRGRAGSTRPTRPCSSGTGETHLAVACERLHRKFGVDVDTEDVRVPYRETITKEADAEGKYKKQTGGHGQFGVANVRIAPSAAAKGSVSSTRSSAGRSPASTSRPSKRAFSRRCRWAASSGTRSSTWRSPAYDGKFHSVDSSEMSFKMAGSLGSERRWPKPHPSCSSPSAASRSPSRRACRATSSETSTRGVVSVQGTDTLENGDQRITALVPTGEIQRYAIDLRSLTGGRGRFSTRARPLRHRPRQPRRQTREAKERLKLKLDLHEIYNKGHDIDRALSDVMDEAVSKKASSIEIIPGKGSGQLKKHVLRFLDEKEIKAMYHRVEKDSTNWGRIFVHFRWK